MKGEYGITPGVDIIGPNTTSSSESTKTRIRSLRADYLQKLVEQISEELAQDESLQRHLDSLRDIMS